MNVGLLTLSSVLLAYRHKVMLNGAMFASILTVAGFHSLGKIYTIPSPLSSVFIYMPILCTNRFLNM